MLVHVTRYTAVQDSVSELIKKELQILKNRIGDSDDELEDLQKIWNDDFIPTTKKMISLERANDSYLHSWEEINKALAKMILKIQVKQINSSAKDTLQYKEAEDAFREILTWMGEDPSREGLLETPKRVVKAFKEYFKGYKEDPNQVLDKTFGDVEGYDDMVVQKNISVQSHCEHHMAPIIGKAHVAYIPKERVVGLSKLARVVEVFSKRLQTQERLTMQIANTLMESLDAKGVAVTIDSTHQCMTMRGIKKEQASTVTNYYLGQFKEDLSYQNRYLRFISISKD